MEQYFFEQVRPIVEKALRDGNRGDWPLITLNLDFKSEQREHLMAVWSLLEKYRAWLTTAPRTPDERALEPLDVRPVLVLTGESDAQEKVFYREVPVGGRLLVFGAVHSHTEAPMSPPEVLESEPATSFCGASRNTLPHFREECSERTFVYRIAHNRGLTPDFPPGMGTPFGIPFRVSELLTVIREQ